MKGRAGLAVLLLGACTAEEPVITARQVPIEFRKCPPAAPAPPSLPIIVTPEALRSFAIATDAAYRSTVKARAECEETLVGLIHWIETPQPPPIKD